MFKESFSRPIKQEIISPTNEQKAGSALDELNVKTDSAMDKKGITRRDFLKFFGIAFGTVALDGIAGQYEKAEASYGIFKKAKDYIRHKLQGTELIIYRKDKDLEIFDKILNFKSKNPIEINLHTAENTKKYWKLEHLGNPKYSNGLYSAYKEMEKNWTPQLKKFFKDEGVPEKYVYLAIPESYWNWKKDSPAGARGPYQFMPATARDFGLRVDEYVDERTNPEKSAGACARYLKYLYGKTHDWNLALAGYNGSLVWDYVDSCHRNDSKSNYEGFLSHLEKEANRYKKEYETGRMKYVVEKDDTLKKIAKKYGLSETNIRKTNNLRASHVEPGASLTLEISNRKMREAILKRRKKTLSENLNYPPKFNAVMEIIEDGIL